VFEIKMVGTIVPEYLGKEDLLYEVESRGAVAAGDADGLRKQFRELLKKVKTPTRNSKWSVTDEVLVCKRKYEEWEGRLEEIVAEPPTGRIKSRQITALLHFKNRVTLLMAADGLDANVKKWAGEVGDYVDKLLDAHEPKNPPLVDLRTVVTGEVAGVAHIDGETAELSEPKEVYAGEPSQAGNYHPKFEKRFPGMTKNTISPSSLVQYGKLPNPVAPMVQRLGIVDGLNPMRLIDFLMDVLKILEVPGINGKDLLQLLMPYCRSPLAERLYEVLHEGGDFDDFHELALAFFVPKRVMERLKADRIFRIQRQGEDMGHFVKDVKRTCKVLRLEMSEAEVVKTILEGLDPSERNRVCFEPRPSSFKDLDKLCVVSRGMYVNDGQRGMSNRPGRMVGAIQTNSRPELQNNSSNSGFGSRYYSNTGGRRGFTCYQCGREGHIKRFCTSGTGRQLQESRHQGSGDRQGYQGTERNSQEQVPKNS
jgi:hypothetical protein